MQVCVSLIYNKISIRVKVREFIFMKLIKGRFIYPLWLCSWCRIYPICQFPTFGTDQSARLVSPSRCMAFNVNQRLREEWYWLVCASVRLCEMSLFIVVIVGVSPSICSLSRPERSQHGRGIVQVKWTTNCWWTIHICIVTLRGLPLSHLHLSFVLIPPIKSSRCYIDFLSTHLYVYNWWGYPLCYISISLFLIQQRCEFFDICICK